MNVNGIGAGYPAAGYETRRTEKQSVQCVGLIIPLQSISQTILNLQFQCIRLRHGIKTEM